MFLALLQKPSGENYLVRLVLDLVQALDVMTELSAPLTIIIHNRQTGIYLENIRPRTEIAVR